MGNPFSVPSTDIALMCRQKLFSEKDGKLQYSLLLLSRLGSFALSPYGSSGVHLSLGVFVDCAEPEGQSDSSLNIARDLFLRVGLNMA
jgi:hypothetical protein